MAKTKPQLKSPEATQPQPQDRDQLKVELLALVKQSNLPFNQQMHLRFLVETDQVLLLSLLRSRTLWMHLDSKAREAAAFVRAHRELSEAQLVQRLSDRILVPPVDPSPVPDSQAQEMAELLRQWLADQGLPA